MSIQLNYPAKKTQIVCTIGPASWSKPVMEKMIANGMNVARVNAAFADRADLQKIEELVKSLDERVTLMLDVKGPEVRMNKFAEAKQIKPGEEFVLGADESYDIYPANRLDLYTKITVGQNILVGDGDVALEVTKIENKEITVKVIYGELLKPGKALNFPGAVLNDDPLTEKDLDLLDYTKEHNWEYISASFIRTAEDAQFIRDRIAGTNMKLIAKIEDADGIANIDEIMPIIDGVMIARGGLGVDMGLVKIPAVIRFLAEKCTQAGKPSIMATQILESMTENPVPTRAEANDAGTAFYLGVDAVMLSSESAAGKYPVEAVEFLSQMAMELEPKLGTKPSKL